MEINEDYRAHLVHRSGNSKTGPIPVSATEEKTCPDSCGLKGQGCFAENGPLRMHWKKVSSGERGVPWEQFCKQIDALLPTQLWRHNAAGDLPGDGKTIDAQALAQLVQSNKGKRGFTYTHYLPSVPGNAEAIAHANANGFTVNLSADSMAQVDALAALGAGPVVVVLPSDAPTLLKTAAGRVVVVCPAVRKENVTCENCGLCYRQRRTVVGFPAHGALKKRIDIKLLKATA